MIRRRFLLAGALCALPLRHAIGQARRAKIGFLLAVPSTKSVLAPIVIARLAELGYDDGKGATFSEYH